MKKRRKVKYAAQVYLVMSIQEGTEKSREKWAS